MFFPNIFYELLELILLRFSYEIKPKMLRNVQARPLQLAKPRAMVKEIFFRYPSLQLSKLVSEQCRWRGAARAVLAQAAAMQLLLTEKIFQVRNWKEQIRP